MILKNTHTPYSILSSKYFDVLMSVMFRFWSVNKQQQDLGRFYMLTFLALSSLKVHPAEAATDHHARLKSHSLAQ